MLLSELHYFTLGVGKLADGKAFTDPEVLRRLTSSVSCALDEAAAALTRMRTQNNGLPSTAGQTTADSGLSGTARLCIFLWSAATARLCFVDVL